MTLELPEFNYEMPISPAVFHVVYQELLLEGFLEHKIFVRYGDSSLATPYLLQCYADGRIEIFIEEDKE